MTKSSFFASHPANTSQSSGASILLARAPVRDYYIGHPLKLATIIITIMDGAGAEMLEVEVEEKEAEDKIILVLTSHGGW